MLPCLFSSYRKLPFPTHNIIITSHTTCKNKDSKDSFFPHCWSTGRKIFDFSSFVYILAQAPRDKKRMCGCQPFSSISRAQAELTIHQCTEINGAHKRDTNSWVGWLLLEISEIIRDPKHSKPGCTGTLTCGLIT